jgi:hypothetical protein
LLDHDTLQSREEVFDKFELSFTIIFTIEIVWNCFGHGIVEFMKDWWSVFDAIVVLISLTSLFLHGSNVKSLRLLRVSRLWMKFVTNRVCVSVSMCLSGQSILFCASAVLANDLCTRLLLLRSTSLSLFHMYSHFHPLLCLVFASISPRILTLSLPHARTHRCTGSQGRAVGGEIQFAQVFREKIKAALQSFDFATRMNISVWISMADLTHGSYLQSVQANALFFSRHQLHAPVHLLLCDFIQTRKIVNALTSAILPVMSAMLVALLVMSIC